MLFFDNEVDIFHGFTITCWDDISDNKPPSFYWTVCTASNCEECDGDLSNCGSCAEGYSDLAGCTSKFTPP